MPNTLSKIGQFGFHTGEGNLLEGLQQGLSDRWSNVQDEKEERRAYLESLSTEELDQYIEEWFQEKAPEMATDLSPMGVFAGATKGMKKGKLANLYHGTPNQQQKRAILEQGFTKGRSAELELPGTSISRDPLISTELFGSSEVDNLVKIQLAIDAGEIHNLRPSEYFSGKVPKGQVYGKPQTTFLESEIYGIRKEQKIGLGEGLQKQIDNKIQDISKQIAQQRNILRGATGRSDPALAKKWKEKYPDSPALDEYNYEVDFKSKVEANEPFDLTKMSEQEAKYITAARRIKQLTEERGKLFNIKYGGDPSGQSLYQVTKQIQPPFKPVPLSAKENLFIRRRQKAYDSLIFNGEFFTDYADLKTKGMPDLLLKMPTGTPEQEAARKLVSTPIDKLSQKDRYLIKRRWRVYLHQIERMKPSHSMWERSILARGQDFQDQRGLLSFLSDVNFMTDILKPLGYKMKDLNKITKDADQVKFALSKFKEYSTDSLIREPIETPAVKEAKDLLDQSYRLYKTKLHKFMKDVNVVFGVD